MWIKWGKICLSFLLELRKTMIESLKVGPSVSMVPISFSKGGLPRKR